MDANPSDWKYWLLFFGEFYVIIVVTGIFIIHLKSKVTLVIEHNTEALKDLKTSMDEQSKRLHESSMQVKYNTKVMEKIEKNFDEARKK